jgi:hypothetical protein
VAIARLGNTLGGDDWLDSGGTLTWMLALFVVLAALCYRRTRAVVCVLLAALAAVGLLLELVNWVFGTEDIDVFRVLLALAFAALFAAGAVLTGRAGTLLIAAAGITVIAGYYAVGFALVFGASGLGWGWELHTLLEGVALAAYAALRLEPGPAYLAFFVLLLFATTAAITGSGASGGVVELDGAETATGSASLVGWPLALAVATVAAALWGLRRAQIAATS